MNYRSCRVCLQIATSGNLFKIKTSNFGEEKGYTPLKEITMEKEQLIQLPTPNSMPQNQVIPVSQVLQPIIIPQPVEYTSRSVDSSRRESITSADNDRTLAIPSNQQQLSVNTSKLGDLYIA